MPQVEDAKWRSRRFPLFDDKENEIGEVVRYSVSFEADSKEHGMKLAQELIANLPDPPKKYDTVTPMVRKIGPRSFRFTFDYRISKRGS